MEGKLLFPPVDKYYGGGGKAQATAARETLTPTEHRINKIIVDLLTDHFRRAFAPVATLEFAHAQTETNPNYITMATPSETMVVTRVEVTLSEGAGGAVTLVLPLSSFEPVRDKLAEGLKTVSPESRQRWHKSLRSQLENAQLELTSVFVETEITLRELLQMKPGDVLPIEMPKTAVPVRAAPARQSAAPRLQRGERARGGEELRVPTLRSPPDECGSFRCGQSPGRVCRAVIAAPRAATVN